MAVEEQPLRFGNVDLRILDVGDLHEHFVVSLHFRGCMNYVGANVVLDEAVSIRIHLPSEHTPVVARVDVLLITRAVVGAGQVLEKLWSLVVVVRTDIGSRAFLSIVAAVATSIARVGAKVLLLVNAEQLAFLGNSAGVSVLFEQSSAHLARRGGDSH